MIAELSKNLWFFYVIAIIEDKDIIMYFCFIFYVSNFIISVSGFQIKEVG